MVTEIVSDVEESLFVCTCFSFGGEGRILTDVSPVSIYGDRTVITSCIQFSLCGTRMTQVLIGIWHRVQQIL